jgi:hypothetical protein
VRTAVFPRNVRETQRRMKKANVHEPVQGPAGNVAIRPYAVAMRHDLIDTPMPTSRLTRPLESLFLVPGTMRSPCEMRGAGQPRRAGCDQTSLRRKMLALAMVACAARAKAFLYWTNFDTGTIGRATVDGTKVDQSFVTGASAPTAVWRSTVLTSTGRTSTTTRSAVPTSTDRTSTRHSSSPPAGRAG